MSIFIASTISASCEYDFSDEGGYEHHSCSYTKCFKCCIGSKLEASSKLELLEKGFEKLVDALIKCTGAKADASDDIKGAFSDVKLGKCGLVCGEAGDTGEAEAIGDCFRCALKNTINNLPIKGIEKAGCPLSLADTIADLLKPTLNCGLECKHPPQIWENDWCHPCHQPYQTKRECYADIYKIQYKCVDCEWKKDMLVRCPIDERCYMENNKPVCKNPCKDIDCSDGNPCTFDICIDGKCSNPVFPGCDKPDDNYDISTFSASDDEVIATDSEPDEIIYEPTEIAILSNGFADIVSKNLEERNISSDIVDIQLNDIEKYPVLIIPSGGLYGIDTSKLFKSKLEDYVRNGGTLIVFAQQHGYEFNALPGNLDGYGWLEDERCQFNSVGISTYHPILARQGSKYLDVNVDGFFTEWPSNSTILLTRVKNGMPAMLLYNYGLGKVLVSALYSDMSPSLYQVTYTETILMEDIITWARAKNKINTYSPGDISLPISIHNYYHGPFGDPITIAYQNPVSMEVNVTNNGNKTADKVSFLLFDLEGTKIWVNLTTDIAPNQSKLVELNASIPEQGVWSIFSLLFSDDDFLGADYPGDFVFQYDLINLTKAYITIYDADGNYIKEENFSFSLPTGATETFNISLNAQKKGIWYARRSVLSGNEVYISDKYYFAISDYAENPDGFTYQGNNITFSVTSDNEWYPFGANATFTIHIWNNNNIDKQITCWWAFLRNYRKTLDPIYGAETTIPGQVKEGLNKIILVAANSHTNFTYTIPVATGDGLWAEFYDENNYLGRSSKGFNGYAPSVGITITTDKQNYSRGEDIYFTVNVSNNIYVSTIENVPHDLTILVKVIGFEEDSFSDSFTAYLNFLEYKNKTYSFSLPPDANPGIYLLSAEAQEGGRKLGSASSYFKIMKDYIMTARFDHPDKAYKVRENITLKLNATNLASSPWDFMLNLDIPSLNYNSTQPVSVNPNSTNTISYLLNIPENLSNGKHDVILNFFNMTLKDAFFIPNSNLFLSHGKTALEAGENVSINLTNSGGIDVGYNCSISFYDPLAKLIFQDNFNGKIIPDEIKTFSFEIPEQLVTGEYYLMALCKDNNLNKTISLSKFYQVSGLKATLFSTTSQDIYVEGDTINIITNITNLDGKIANATLNIRIIKTAEPLCLCDNTTECEENCSCDIDCAQQGCSSITDLEICAVTEGCMWDPELSQCKETVGHSGSMNLNADESSIGEDNKKDSKKLSIEGNQIEVKSGSMGINAKSIDTETVWEDKVIVLNEDLIVNSSLTLINTTLIMNCSNDGKYKIEVNEGGEMHILDGSNITSMNPDYEYCFNVMPGTIFEMRISELHECGYTVWGNCSGLLVYTDNAVIDSNRISDNNYGVLLYQSNKSNITNNKFISNAQADVELFNASNSKVEGNNMDSPSYGIILAYSRDSTIRNNKANSGIHAFMLVNSKNIRVESNNLTSDGGCIELDETNNSELINNNATSTEMNSILLIDKSHNNKILGNNFVSGKENGIYLQYSDNNTMSDNNVSLNSLNGIYLKNSNYNQISYIEANSNNGHGIYTDNSNYTNISNCNANSNSGYGIYLYYSSNSNVEDTNANLNNDGIYVEYSDNNKIVNNDVDSNGYYGIYIFGSSNCDIENNHIFSNNNGLLIHFDSDNNNISSNSISLNNEGISIISGSYDNLIFNNYLDNTANVYDDEVNSWNTVKTLGPNIIGGPWIGGNYFSDYRGRDIDGDGFGDTHLPYNKGIETGGDYLPLVKPRAAEIIFEVNRTIDINESQTRTILTSIPLDTLEDPEGKLKLTTKLYFNEQIIAQEDPFFYVTYSGTAVTMETDKTAYKPNETVNITGTVKNLGSAVEAYTLSIKKENVQIFTENFALNPDETHEFSLTTIADSSFNLEATAGKTTVTDFINVIKPDINLSIITPEVVSSDPFTVGVLIKNIADIEAYLNVNDMGNFTLPVFATKLLEKNLSITQNTTITINVSGDVDKSVKKDIIFGLEIETAINPDPTYIEGIVEIPYITSNKGLLDASFNASFKIGNTIIIKEIFVSAGNNDTGMVSFNLPKGTHTLNYSSPFENLSLRINVMSPPEFIVANIYPNTSFVIGQFVNLTFELMNIGGMEGEASFMLLMPDSQSEGITWIKPGEKENLSFSFTMPDDLEEKKYKGEYEINNIREEFDFYVSGAKILVNASLDKQLYEENETALLTVDVANNCSFNLSLYARVNLNGYEEIRYFNLTDHEQLQFNIPVSFNGQKLLYGIYTETGRSLYLNALYVYKKEGILLYTDKQVYEQGENVTIFADTTGTLNITAPELNESVFVAGLTSIEFTLPEEMASGTYYIKYALDNSTFIYPFDVIGYSARITECNIYTETDQSVKVTVNMNMETNENISGVVKFWIYDLKNNLMGSFEADKNFVEGENELTASGEFSTDRNGVYSLIYKMYTNSDLLFASGLEFFDVTDFIDYKTVKLDLKEGWNLISIPFNLENNSVENVFNSINYYYIFSYGLAWEVPTEIINTKGYWIKSDSGIVAIDGVEPGNISINLDDGWNLIGYPYLEEKEISELCNATVYAYKDSAWYSHNPNKPSNNLNKFIPGYGYWVKK